MLLKDGVHDIALAFEAWGARALNDAVVKRQRRRIGNAVNAGPVVGELCVLRELALPLLGIP
ncbi:unannotated protein [freshwater metagenome]|uniref:Unannotated protein n=1 Tax=freshwater metagenome TaxID=449393 RepID=A0A6J7HVV6_9ZZZZ